MGNWAITIHGIGCHGNAAIPDDADRMAARFVEELRAKGHTVTSAKFTHGGEADITDGEAYEKRKVWPHGRPF